MFLGLFSHFLLMWGASLLFLKVHFSILTITLVCLSVGKYGKRSGNKISDTPNVSFLNTFQLVSLFVPGLTILPLSPLAGGSTVEKVHVQKRAYPLFCAPALNVPSFSFPSSAGLVMRRKVSVATSTC